MADVILGSARRRLFFAAVLSLGVAACGTGEKPASESTEAAADGSSSAESSSSGVRGLRIRPNVNTLVGTWGLIITQPLQDRDGQPKFRDLCVALVKFEQQSGDQLSASVLAGMPDFPPIEVSDAKSDGSRLSFAMTWGDAAGDFEGSLQDGVIRGSLRNPRLGTIAAMMRPTEETSYEGWDPVPIASGLTRFNEALQSKDQPTAILEAAKEMRGTALSLHAYDGVVNRLGQYPSLDKARLIELYDDYLNAAELWGPRMVAQARARAALNVTVTRRFPELALEWLAAAEKSHDQLTQDLATSLEAGRDQAHVDLALRDIKAEDAAVQAEAYSRLQELLPKQRYNPEILEALGLYAANHEQPEQAITYLGDVVALPLLEAMLREMRSGQPPGDPTPRERLLSIWEQKHGSVTGFDEFLVNTYEERLAELSEQVRAEGPQPVPTEERQRTALVELFTGITCPPCVAADLALAILRETYPDSDVVALQYHQHIPGPDPLANLDAEDRFTYFEGAGTPTVVIDGVLQPPGGASGLMHHVEHAYQQIRLAVDHRLKTASKAELDISAEVKEGNLVVAVTADVPEGDAGNLRLRVALAENQIDLEAPNGIRSHHLVVREMLGGARGTAPQDGKFEYKLETPLSEIEQHLEDYLQQFEVGRDFEFPVKPTKLGALSIVAWVQDDSTREVLQCRIASVTGSAAATPSADAEATPAAQPASAEQPVNVPQ